MIEIQWMKQVDRLAGYPLCGAARAFELVRSGRGGPAADAAAPERTAALLRGPSRIGVVKFWGMGSLVLAAPMFSALRRSFPNSEIHLLTLAPNRGIIELLDLAHQVHYLDLAGSPAAILSRIAAHLAGARRLGLDAVIDLEYLTRFSALTSYATRAPVRVGFFSWDVWRGDLHTIRRAFNPYWHVTENFLNLHRALGRDPGETEPARVRLDGREDREAAEALARAGVRDDETVIAINPNASTMALARRWPDQYFIELADRLAESDRGRVVMLGAPEEAAYVEDLLRRSRRPERIVSLAGRTSLRGLVGTLRRARLLITNDSGPLHLASALGTPTVSFFGPETPSLYGPRGPGHTALYRGIDCSPCINIYNAKTVRCMRSRPECLTGITVDQALAAALRALEGAR